MVGEPHSEIDRIAYAYREETDSGNDQGEICIILICKDKCGAGNTYGTHRNKGQDKVSKIGEKYGMAKIIDYPEKGHNPQ